MEFNYTDAVLDTPLKRAVLRHNSSEVKEALDRGFNANLPDNRGWTPVHEAAVEDVRCDCLKELLAHPSANINGQTFEGETPLFLACKSGSLKCVNLLLKQSRCNINLPNNEASSPLHIACFSGHLEIVKCLVNFGSNVNGQDCSGYTPLHEAVAATAGKANPKEDEYFQICCFLLKHGANPDLLERDGNHPFHFACQDGILKCINLLLQFSKKSDLVNICNREGRSALMMGVQSKNTLVVQELLSKGANPNVADSSGIIALHIAAHSGNIDIFNTILEVTSYECILNYCTFNEERDVNKMSHNMSLNSVVCLAIDTDDLSFLINVLESNVDKAVLQCPVIHAENKAKNTFTLHTPISFLVESKMYDLGERTFQFLLELIRHGNPLKVTSNSNVISYVSPVCAALVALNECPRKLVLQCLKLLLEQGADPDEPERSMPYAMEQACMRDFPEAVLLLLQYSNVLEPDDLIRWIENETSSNQEKIIELLLPLAPYYKPSEKLLTIIKRKSLLTPQVYTLVNYCRSVVRKQIHVETGNNPYLFHEKLSELDLPKNLCCFLKFNFCEVG